MSTPQFCWDNHYKIGYNREWFSFRSDVTDRLDIEVSGCTRVPKGVNFEAVNAANIMIDKYGQSNIALLYSGGADSEIALLSFKASDRIPGRVIFLDYGTNKYDLYYATRFCDFYGIKLEIIKMDVQTMLLSGESVDICNKYQCAQVGLSFYLKTIEEVCKTNYIVTGDDPYFEKVSNPGTGTIDWNFFAREPFYALWKVFAAAGVDGCPNFIQYTPELFLSFIDDQFMTWMRNDQTQLDTSNQIKRRIYQSRFFINMRAKSTGMEEISDLISAQNEKLLYYHPEWTMNELQYPLDKMRYELTRYIKNDYSPS
jgi:hypothetical protein